MTKKDIKERLKINYQTLYTLFRNDESILLSMDSDQNNIRTEIDKIVLFKAKYYSKTTKEDLLTLLINAQKLVDWALNI